MSVRVLLLWLLLAPLGALAQGFAGLGTEVEGFALPIPETELTFPADHGPHPEFRIEWWYLTANLRGADGAEYGLQWTLFRTALAPGEGEGWNSPQVWFGHAAVTTAQAHHATERLARGGIGQAGVTAAPFAAWIDDWEMSGDSLNALRLRASAPEFAYDIRLEAEGALVLHGDDGYSVKSALGQASYYYSQPFYRLEGRLTLPEGAVEVTGEAWLDREWSSQPLAPEQTGWDWFSLSLETGDKLMLFRLREEDGTSFGAATWIGADGAVRALPDGAITASPTRLGTVAGRELPLDWRIDWPEGGLALETRPLFDGAWMDLSIPYWEGPVIVSGSHEGRGYLEMTGYE